MIETDFHLRLVYQLDKSQIQLLFKLWNEEYPTEFSYSSIKDFEQYIDNMYYPFHYILMDESFNTIAWSCVFQRENEVWFAIIVDSKYKSKGYGSLLLNQLKKYHPILNGWVIDQSDIRKQNGERYISPLPFYLKNDFKLIPDVLVELNNVPARKITWKR